MFEEEIKKILFNNLKEFYPDFEVAEYTIDDDLSKIFPFSSFEWMVVICEIEDKFNICFNDDFFSKRTIAAMKNLI